MCAAHIYYIYFILHILYTTHTHSCTLRSISLTVALGECEMFKHCRKILYFYSYVTSSF